MTRSDFFRLSSIALASVVGASFIASCATSRTARRGQTTDRSQVGVQTTEARRNITEEFRREMRQTQSPDGRRQVAESAVEAAREADQPLEAIDLLLDALRRERDPQTASTFEEQILNLIDRDVSPAGVVALLGESRRGEFPHEHLLYKKALLELHTRDIVAAESTLASYLSTYPTGRYTERAEERLSRVRALEDVRPRTVGILLPLSGRRAALGRLARQALDLAFRGSSVRTVVKDTKDNEARAAAAVASLVLEEGAIAIVGPIFRSESRAAAVMAQRLGVSLVTISNADEVADMGAWVFRNGVTNRTEAKAIAAHAMDVMGLKNFAILHPRHPFGIELRDIFWDEVVARGGEIRGVEDYDVDATTFSRQVKRLVGRHNPERRPDFQEAILECEEQPDPYRKARCEDGLKKNLKPLVDFDGLFIPDSARRIRMIAAALAAEDIIVEKDPKRLEIIEKTLGRMPKVVTLLGASGWNSKKVTESTGRTVENAVFTDGFYSNAEDERTTRFVRAYETRYSREPRLYEALMYDSAQIIRSIVESQRPQTRVEFRDALKAVRRFPGVTGPTSFEKNDASKELRVLTITNGSIVEIPKSVDEAPARHRRSRR